MAERTGRAQKEASADAAQPPARQPSQTRKAAAQLRSMIVENVLAAGANVLESELADMLGMSRTPVREAILILESHGLVDVIPRRGFRVRPISARDMEEIYTILTELEAAAAEAVARRGLSHAELRALETLLEEMEAALAVDDRARWAELDDAFHQHLVQLAGNHRLETTVLNFHDQVRRARTFTLYMRPAPHQSNADHRALVGAIAAGDDARARALHRAHRLTAKTLLVEILSNRGIGSL